MRPSDSCASAFAVVGCRLPEGRSRGRPGLGSQLLKGGGWRGEDEPQQLAFIPSPPLTSLNAGCAAAVTFVCPRALCKVPFFCSLQGLK